MVRMPSLVLATLVLLPFSSKCRSRGFQGIRLVLPKIVLLAFLTLPVISSCQCHSITQNIRVAPQSHPLWHRYRYPLAPPLRHILPAQQTAPLSLINLQVPPHRRKFHPSLHPSFSAIGVFECTDQGIVRIDKAGDKTTSIHLTVAYNADLNRITYSV